MGRGRIYQATIALLLILSVSVVGAAVTYSRGQAGARIQRAVYQAETQGSLPLPTDGAPTAPADENRAVPNDPVDAAQPGGSVTPDESAVLEKQLRSYRVRLAADGTLSGIVNVYDAASGSVIAMSDIRVLFLQHGAIKARTTPGSDGVFKVALQPGVYALVASGPQGYAAYSVQAIKADAVVQNVSLQEIRNSVEISTLAVPSRDFETVRRLARTYIPREALGKGSDSDTVGQMDAPPVDGVVPETTIDGHSVSVRDGVLLGRMRRLHPETGKPLKIRRLNAFLVQNNSVLATAPVNESGFFKFKNVDPGVYSFVAAGSDGLAAFSFQAVNSMVASKDTPSQLTLVSFADGDGVSGSTVGPENMGVAADNIGEENEEQTGTGGTGGGSGGGAGGGGGGLGGLGLLGLAGLAGLIDDDDDNGKPNTPDM